MSSNLDCIGLEFSDAAGLGEFLESVRSELTLIGTRGRVHVHRWQDPSGARLVVSVRGGEVLDFAPSFAGRPGVRMTSIRALNDDAVTADVIDEDGAQSTSMVFELEQRRALGRKTDWTGTASMTAFAPGAEFFADEAAFETAPASLMNPDAAPEDQLFTAPDGVERVMRVAPESFFAYSVFDDAADAEAYGRLTGSVVSAETRTNSVTGREFLTCRVACLGFELDLLAPVPDHGVPKPGELVAAQAFFIASIEDLPWRKRIFSR